MVTVALDIGHGSNTFPPGKGVYRNGRGYAEHDFNSKLAIAIRRLLEANGVNVIYGQNPYSPDVSLRTRTNLYNREKVDLVVSVHANANASTAVNGRCAFYWHTSSDGKKLAQFVIDEIKAKGYSTHGTGLHASRKGSWTNLHITRETRMPAVLIEHGFMTGNKDFDLIFGSQQDKYIHDMAEADAQAILRYFGKNYSKPEGKVKVVASDNLYRVQVGAFSNKENAENLAEELKAKGYPVYIPESSSVSVPKKEVKSKPKKTAREVAEDIVNNPNHKWGNNPERRQRLEASGYNADEVQSIVNSLVAKNTESKTPSFKVGERVRIKNSARTYATGENIPARLRGNTYTIQQVKSDRVLLKEIYSWVRRADVEKP